MNKDELMNKAMAALIKTIPEAVPAEIDAGVNFRAQLEIDSIDYLNFVLVLEESFDIKIPAVDYPKLSCLNGCLAYLEARLKAHSQ